MSALLIASLVGLSQGLLHGVGPDHCAAIATLATSRRRAWAVALRFGLGHSGVLALVAAGCLLFEVGVSETVTRWAEVLGGGVLIALAAASLFRPGFLAHGHPHLPPHGEDDHRHGRVGATAGALMALSGVRALLLAIPPLLVGTHSSLAAWSYLPAFALGVFASMSAVGALAGRGREALERRGYSRLLQKAVALSTGALGVFWIAGQA